MSDVVMSIYVFVVLGLIAVLMFHTALRHKKIVSILKFLAFIGVFLSTVGGLLLLGTFTPGMAEYDQTSRALYSAFTWGGIQLPEYSEMMVGVNNLGVLINAMGLGVLIMALLSGFFPRSFFTTLGHKNQAQTH